MKTKFLKLVPVILFLAAFTNQAAGNRYLPATSASGHEYQYQLTSGNLNMLCLNFNTNCMVQDTDNELSLESWMTDQDFWENTIYLQQEQDFPLRMESWMTEEDLWHSCQKRTAFNGTKIKGSEAYNRRDIWECMNYVPIEMEGLIISDSWMTDDHVWCNEYSVTVFVPLER
jgi:hypothetical protein